MADKEVRRRRRKSGQSPRHGQKDRPQESKPTSAPDGKAASRVEDNPKRTPAHLDASSKMAMIVFVLLALSLVTLIGLVFIAIEESSDLPPVTYHSYLVTGSHDDHLDAQNDSLPPIEDVVSTTTQPERGSSIIHSPETVAIQNKWEETEQPMATESRSIVLDNSVHETETSVVSESTIMALEESGTHKTTIDPTLSNKEPDSNTQTAEHNEASTENKLETSSIESSIKLSSVPAETATENVDKVINNLKSEFADHSPKSTEQPDNVVKPKEDKHPQTVHSLEPDFQHITKNTDNVHSIESPVLLLDEPTQKHKPGLGDATDVPKELSQSTTTPSNDESSESLVSEPSVHISNIQEDLKPITVIPELPPIEAKVVKMSTSEASTSDTSSTVHEQESKGVADNVANGDIEPNVHSSNIQEELNPSEILTLPPVETKVNKKSTPETEKSETLSTVVELDSKGEIVNGVSEVKMTYTTKTQTQSPADIDPSDNVLEQSKNSALPAPETSGESEPKILLSDSTDSPAKPKSNSSASSATAQQKPKILVPTTETPSKLYLKIDITNEEDYEIRHELDEIDNTSKNSPEKALSLYQELLRLSPSSPRALFGKAVCLDKMAASQRSNKLLEEAIAVYQDVLKAKNVPDKLYLTAGFKCIERMQFRGLVGKSVKLLGEMAKVYPNNMEIKNKIGVGFLLIGQNAQAKRVFTEVLRDSPSNGFAKVHLGFILKTEESKYEDAITLLSQGIASREPGVIDGRFYFHLGDALARSGRKEQAMKVYEDGTKEGLFLSPYQRSLYNVKGLAGKPWWNPLETKYAHSFEILENNWIAIRGEALSLMNEKSSGFQPESEGLQDGGNWKQFEMFMKGRKIAKNCAKAPITCALVEKMPDAASCKRGQVKFSIMQPDTHIWAHTGPTNCRLRAHLGLVVPDGASLRVAEETKTWQEGKVILFDDSFEHEVWHNGTSFRLVLIVDFWHPELTANQRASLSPI